MRLSSDVLNRDTDAPTDVRENIPMHAYPITMECTRPVTAYQSTNTFWAYHTRGGDGLRHPCYAAAIHLEPADEAETEGTSPRVLDARSLSHVYSLSDSAAVSSILRLWAFVSRNYESKI